MPKDFDPEDAHNVGVETEDMANADPAAREHYFDVGWVLESDRVFVTID